MYVVLKKIEIVIFFGGGLLETSYHWKLGTCIFHLSLWLTQISDNFMSWQDELNACVWTLVFPILLLIDQVPLFGHWPWLGDKNKDMHVSVQCMFSVWWFFFSPQENVFMILHYMHFFLQWRRVHIFAAFPLLQ